MAMSDNQHAIASQFKTPSLNLVLGIKYRAKTPRRNFTNDEAIFSGSV
jgi:hypothetical protein